MNGLIGQSLDIFGEIEFGIVFHHFAVVGKVDREGLATQRTLIDQIDDLIDDDLPVVDLVGDDDAGGQFGLIRLGAKPKSALFFGNTNSTDDHLSCAGEHIRACGNMRVGSFGGQSNIGERANVVHVDLHIGIGRLSPGDKAIDVELGITGLNGANNANHIALREAGSHDAVDVTALIGGSLISEDIIQTKRVYRGAPGKAGLGEVRGNFLQRGTVLRAMADDQIIALSSIVSQRSSGIVHDEHAIGIDKFHRFFAAHLFLNSQQSIIHALAEGKVIDRAGHNHGHTEFII